MCTYRVWRYKSDGANQGTFNYYEGRRNGHRLLFSNDGLIFVTYNHYVTFYELSSGGANEDN